MDRADTERKIMEATVDEKIWQIPAYNGTGPVTIALRMPEVTITDSAGRHIVISPKQAEVVGARMEDIGMWIEEGAED
jgi:hypothetical protein